MTRSKGKLVALALAVVGMATLGVTGFALRGWVVEDYYIWKLESTDQREVNAAAETLAEMSSVRAVPALLEAGIRTDKEALYDAIGRIGRSALPPLSQAFDKGEPWRTAVHYCVIKISKSEDLGNDVEALLLWLEYDSPPGSVLHKAATDLLPKLKAFQSQTDRTSTDQVSP